VAAAIACSSPAGPRFVTQVPWAGQGTWLKADTHVHTKFSDGANSVEDVVAKAESFGCDVIAITDHTDHDLKGATPEYFAAIEAARQAHPRMVILGGVEWNLPPWGGEEHATVLVDPSVERKLAEFKEQFDDLGRKTHEAALATAGLKWLAANASANGIEPVVIYQHPSRPDEHSIENVADIKAWRAVNGLVVGFAGAPGHQGDNPIGSYKYKEKPIDRWDPVAARVGDAWDTLLGSGFDVWAADAPSDFHNDRELHDFWPGEFSETWLYAPTRDVAGVLRAYRAGSYFGDHGRFVREVELHVTAPGLPRPAGAGETIAAPAGTSLTADVVLRVPAQAQPAGENHVDAIEIIAIDASGAKVIASGAPASTGPALSTTVTVADGGVVLRARGYRQLPDGTKVAFYTNPVRVKAPAP
jgi:hypothetical protein